MNNILNYPDNFSNIEFSLLSDDDIIKLSAGEIISTAQITKNNPESGGLYDPVMGSISYSYNCGSCRKTVNDCPGHIGHYNLNYPLIQQLTSKFIVKFLNIICIRCFKLILDPSIKFKNGEYLYPEFYEDSSNYVDKFETILKKIIDKKTKKTIPNFCDYCNNLQEFVLENNSKKFSPHIIQPQYKINNSYGDIFVVTEQSVFAENSKQKKSYEVNRKLESLNKYSVLLFPLEIRERFEMLKDSEFIKLGFNIKSHPKNFIHRVLLIPPVNLRHINHTNSKDYNNFITSALELIIQGDLKLDYIPKYTEITYPTFIKQITDIASKYKNYIVSKTEDETEVSSSINGKLKGKKGIIRNDLLGKKISRVFRVVITCNIDINIDTIGLPLAFAKSMYYKEYVTQYNIIKLQKIVNNINKYPGCNKIKPASTGKPRENDGSYKLQIGDQVYRHLLNGDIIPICRFPTLYVTSISCVKIHVLNKKRDDNAINMNVLICPIFNADFDGDTVSGFALADENVRAETNYLANIENNFTNGEDGSAWFGQEQDTVAGCGFLTMGDKKFTLLETKLLLNKVPISEQLDKEFYTGREIFSMVMPNINLEMESPFFKGRSIMDKYYKFDESDKKIVIKNGKLLSGIVCGGAIKAKKVGNIYHIIANYYDTKTALRTIWYHQTIIKNFLHMFPVTLNFNSFIVGERSKDMIRIIQSEIQYEITELNMKLMRGQIIPPSGVELSDHIERLILGIVDDNKLSNKYFGALLADIDPRENWLMLMMLMGSKGSLQNITKMLCPIGQVKLNQKRLPYGLDLMRTNIWSKQFDLSLESRGYINTSLMDGTNLRDLNPQSISARDNICTKGMVTSEAGSEGRTVNINFNSQIIDNKLFLSRIDTREIIQFCPGDDCYEYKNLYPSKYLLMNKNREEIEKLFPKENGFLDIIIRERNEFIKNRISLERGNITYIMDDTILSPLNMSQIISLLVPEKQDNPASLNYITNTINNFVDNLHDIRFSSEYKDVPKPSILSYGFNTTKILIRSYFTLDVMKRLSEEHLQIILGKILNQVVVNLVHVGGAYGLNISLTAISPLTQYLIDAHHSNASGGTSKDGINDFKTIINLKEQSSMHSKKTFIFLKPEFEENEELAIILSNVVMNYTIQDFALESRFLFESLGECITFPEDKEHIKEANKVYGFKKENFLHYCFRFELNNEMLKKKTISIDNILMKIEKEFNNKIRILYYFKAEILIIYMFFDKGFNFIPPDQSDKKNKTITKKIVYNFLNDYILKKFNISRFDNLTNSKVRSVTKAYYEENDGFVEFKTKKIFYIEADGLNLVDLYTINIIDPYRSFCNDMNMMFYYYGYNETRTRIIDMISYAFSTLSLLKTNYILIADTIMEKGYPTKINLNGLIDREKDDYLLRGSYKSPNDQFSEAAINNVTSKIQSPNSNMIIGQTPNIGSKYNKIIFNKNFISDKKIYQEEDIL